MSEGLSRDYSDEEDPLDSVEIGTAEYDGPVAPPIIRSNDVPAQQKPRKPLTLKPFIFGLKACLVLAAILAYPATVVMSHQINDEPVDLEVGRYWSMQDIGVSTILLGRELDGAGWAADRHPWHPQAQLTALPAWQEGLRASIAEHARLTLSTLSGQRDQDLVAAERLLLNEDGLDATPRLQAAREAFTRYDDRVGAGVAGSPQGLNFLERELTLTLGWAAQSSAQLADISTPGDGWLASREAVAAVYFGKARAHAAHEFLNAIRNREANALEGHPAASQVDLALKKWRSAAQLNPLFVSNQGSDGVIGANHPAILAFRLNEAHAATSEAIALLSADGAEQIGDQAP